MSGNQLETVLQAMAVRNEKAFIPYIMAGDGGLGELEPRLKRLEEAGAAAVELGIPFSDPVADGPVIQRAGKRALDNGTTLKGIFGQLKQIRGNIQIPILFMCYLNSVLSYGIEAFAEDCRKTGVSGCIIPDLPYEEEQILEPLKEQGILLIRLVSLTSPRERIEKIADGARGFLYAVTVNGITGARGSFNHGAGEYLELVKSLSTVPVLAGFGISLPEHVREASVHCDGVIAGSQIIEYFETHSYAELAELVSSAGAIKEPKSCVTEQIRL